MRQRDWLKGYMHIVSQDLSVQRTLRQVIDPQSKPHQLHPPFETAWVLYNFSKNGSCRNANRQATTDIPQKGRLHALQLFGIGNEVASKVSSHGPSQQDS